MVLLFVKRFSKITNFVAYTHNKQTFKRKNELFDLLDLSSVLSKLLSSVFFDNSYLFS